MSIIGRPRTPGILLPSRQMGTPGTRLSVGGWPGPVFSTVNYKGSNYSTTCRIYVPSAHEDGDLLVAFLGTTVTTSTITAPAGWTQIQFGNGSFPAMGAWYRVANSEPSYYDFTRDGAVNNFPGMIMLFTGASGIDGSSAVAYLASGGLMVASGITTTQDFDLLLALYGDGNDVKTWPAGWEQIAAVSSTGNIVLYVIAKQFEKAGPTGDITSNKQYSGASGSMLLAIKP